MAKCLKTSWYPPGFTSFYVKAVVEALKRYPEVNASIDGDDVVYHNYFDVSMAVSTLRGLVTPVLRDVDTLGMADIEKKLKNWLSKAATAADRRRPDRW